MVECLRQICKVNWVAGVRKLFGYRRVKMLFVSVNDVTNFCAVLDVFIQLLVKEM